MLRKITRVGIFFLGLLVVYILLFQYIPSIVKVGLSDKHEISATDRSGAVLKRNSGKKGINTHSKRISVNLTVPDWQELRGRFRWLGPGGRFEPFNCSDSHRVAIIIPYRNRSSQLRVFLQNMHPFLWRQNIQYGIYVIELVTEVKFNRGMLLNIGVVEASKFADYQCYVFHDVDLLPEDDGILYTCSRMPSHLSATVSTFDYKLPYPELFGGVSAMSKQHFHLVNGFSNLYFGWGGEDDDMYLRIIANGLTVSRYPEQIARYLMINHTRDTNNEENPHRKRMIETFERYRSDGLNSLRYRLLATKMETTHTQVLVHVDPADYNTKDYSYPDLTDKDIVVGMLFCIFLICLVFAIYITCTKK